MQKISTSVKRNILLFSIWLVVVLFPHVFIYIRNGKPQTHLPIEWEYFYEAVSFAGIIAIIIFVMAMGKANRNLFSYITLILCIPVLCFIALVIIYRIAAQQAMGAFF